MKTKTLLLALIISCSSYVIANNNEVETLPSAVVNQLNEMGIDDLSTVTIIKITENHDGTTTYTLCLNKTDSGGGLCVEDNFDA